MKYVIPCMIFTIQLTSMLIVAWAVLSLFIKHMQRLFATEIEDNISHRRNYISAILVVLEVLVAAGVLTTILHPSWSIIGKLAAIAALRMLIKKSLIYTGGLQNGVT